MKQLTGREFDDRWLLQFGEVSQGLNLRFFQFFEDFLIKKSFLCKCNMYSLWKCFLSEDSKEGREAAEWPVGLSDRLGVSATSATF